MHSSAMYVKARANGIPRAAVVGMTADDLTMPSWAARFRSMLLTDDARNAGANGDACPKNFRAGYIAWLQNCSRDCGCSILSDEKGALCGKIFADMGAEVIKVEPPQGCPTRNIPPFLDDEPGLDRSLYFLAFRPASNRSRSTSKAQTVASY